MNFLRNGAHHRFLPEVRRPGEFFFPFQEPAPGGQFGKKWPPAGIALLAILFIGSGCARFRIEELKSNLIVSIPFFTEASRTEKDRLIVPVNDRLITDLPVRPAIDDDLIYLPDAAGEKIRTYSLRSGNPEFMYGPGSLPEGSKFTLRKVRIGIPGWVTANENGILYVQSYTPDKPPHDQSREKTPPEERMPGRLNFDSVKIAPSRILQIDSNGQLVATIGISGIGGDPFSQIYRMDAFEDLLYVEHDEGEGRTMTVYRNGLPVRYYSVTSLIKPEDQRNFHIDIEEIIPSFKEEYAYASIAYRNKKSYDPIMRKIFRIHNDGRSKELLKVDDANDFFAWGREDGGFYLINSEEDGSGVLYKIYSSEGEYLNNRLIRFPGIRASWRDIFITPEGRFLTTRLNHGLYELYEWK